MPFRGCSCGHSGGFRIEGRKKKKEQKRDEEREGE